MMLDKIILVILVSYLNHRILNVFADGSNEKSVSETHVPRKKIFGGSMRFEIFKWEQFSIRSRLFDNHKFRSFVIYT
jgi:hypothetical protein